MEADQKLWRPATIYGQKRGATIFDLLPFGASFFPPKAFSIGSNLSRIPNHSNKFLKMTDVIMDHQLQQITGLFLSRYISVLYPKTICTQKS